MLQFSKRLSSKGIHLTLATTLFSTHRLYLLDGALTSIVVKSVHDNTALHQQLNWKGQLDRFQAEATKTIS